MYLRLRGIRVTDSASLFCLLISRNLFDPCKWLFLILSSSTGYFLVLLVPSVPCKWSFLILSLAFIPHKWPFLLYSLSLLFLICGPVLHLPCLLFLMDGLTSSRAHIPPLVLSSLTIPSYAFHPLLYLEVRFSLIPS